MWNKRSYPMKCNAENSPSGMASNVYFHGSREYTTGVDLADIASESQNNLPSDETSLSQGRPTTEADEKKRSPLLFCKLIVRYPWHAFGVTLLGHLLMLGVSLALIFMKKNVFPGEFRQIPFHLNGHHVLVETWGWTYRNSDPREIFPRLTINVPYWERGINTDPLQILYFAQDRGGNVLTKDMLQQIKAMEDWLGSDGDYTEKLCQHTKQGQCVAPRSILRYFDGSMANISSTFNDPQFDNVTTVVWEAYTNPSSRNSFIYFLGNKSDIQKHSVYSDYLRSSFPVGYPIKGQSWSSYVGEMAFHIIAPAIEEQQPNLAPDLHVSPISWNLFVSGAAVYGVHDVMLVLGSVTFIFIFIWFQTGSLWLTFFAVFSIATSFFGTNLIYRYALDFRYFSYFHLIAMFIILGIGADDIFVFINTWRLSAFDKHPSLEHRMSDVYRRACLSMFVTSFTTMVAFFVTSLSPLLAARSFGLFTGLLVIVNYVSVVVFFPCVVVLYHKYFEHKEIFRSLLQKAKLCCSLPKEDGNPNEQSKPKKPSRVVEFFKGPYFETITHPIIRWILLSLFVIIVFVFSWFVSTLRPDSEQVMIFKDSTLLGRGWKLTFGAFKPMDDTLLTNNIVWGIRPRNVSNCHFSAYNCRGRASWDEAFDMNQPEVQISMRDFCHKIKYRLSDEEVGALHIRRNERNETEVHCFMDEMGTFLEAEAHRLQSVTGKKFDLSFPLTERKVRPFMEQLSHPDCICPLCFYDLRKLPTTFHRYFEVMLFYWLTHRYTLADTDNFRKYKDMLGEGPDGSNTRLIELFSNSSGCSIFDMVNISSKYNRSTIPYEALPRYGTKLRYAAIPINLTLNFFGLSYAEGLPIYYAWQDFLTKELPYLPYELRRAMQANAGQWHWLFVQETVVHSAILGVGLGIGLALPVLILATQNFIVGTLSTLIIAATCACVIGVIPLCGWKLGLLVSVNLCLVVGLSVDYIVHMSEGYYMSTFRHRADKVKDTLGKTGISVLSGAITTLGASFFMFFGNTQFFLQFAVFMFSTIGFSTLFSLGLFPVLMVILGPQGKTGSFSDLWQKMKRRATGRKKSDLKCERCGGKGFICPETVAETTGTDIMTRCPCGDKENMNPGPCFEPEPTAGAVILGPGNSSVFYQGAAAYSNLGFDSGIPPNDPGILDTSEPSSFNLK